MTLLLGIALANGPDRNPGRTPLGEMRVATDSVRLVHEELEITLMSVDEVEVRATYQLHNPGESAVIRFSVPVTSGGEGGDFRESNAAASVRVLSDGRFVPCLVQEGEPLPTPWAALGGTVDRWCTADLTVPAGSSEVRMSYEGALLFQRPQSPQDLLPRGADRKLVYALAPAGSWAKKPDEVAITVDLAMFRDRAKVVQPEKSTRDGRFLTWSLSKPDLEKVPWIEVDLRAADLDQHAVIAGLNATPSPWSPAVVRVPEGDPAVLRDADAKTAWCGPGGSAIELEWPPPTERIEAACRLGLVHIPGDASSAERWAKTGPQSLTLTPCGAETPSQPVPVRRASSPDQSGQVTPIDAALTEAFLAAWRATEPVTTPTCVRVELAGTSEVCLAELAWHAVCDRP
ncbi:MAG: hypothetical protein R3F61_37875 [Myxococcota bacterium]